MQLKLFAGQTALPLATQQYRRTVSDQCAKTLARQIFTEVQTKKVSGESNLPDMRIYVNSQLQNKNDAEPHGLNQFYSSQDKG